MNPNIQHYLETKAQGRDIAAEVAREALEYSDEDVGAFFSDLQAHGCVSGMIGSLIYYRDTHAFFDRHYDEIQAIRWRMEDEGILPSMRGHDLKNFYAWFAFEEVAYTMAGELGLS